MTNRELRRSLRRADWAIFNWRYILIPIKKGSMLRLFNDGRQVEYRYLYIFGLRLARWRV